MTTRPVQLFLPAGESAPFLRDEVSRAFPQAACDTTPGGLLACDFSLSPAAPPLFVFARQLLPDAEEHTAPSITAWGDRLFTHAAQALPAGRPWFLHVVPHYGQSPVRASSPRPSPPSDGGEGVRGHAGQNRGRLICENLRERLQRKHRALLRSLRDAPEPFTPSHSLVQLLLTAPDRGFISVAPAPLPFALRQTLSPFPKGEITVASDKTAPSRAFAKLVEAELRLGRPIAPGETCVDLGASPGSWSYVALARGAQVTAVDRAPLRDDLMRHPRLTFQQGDAFAFAPAAPVDWLLCDVIAAPERSIGLLLEWLRARRARRFVVTIKFKGRDDYAQLEALKRALPPLCEDFLLTRLCANKNEACALGVARA